MPLVTSTPYAIPSFESVILGDNPLFWYRLGETSGTTAVDEISANNGTYINTPTLNQTGLIKGNSDPAVTFTASSSERVSLSTAIELGNRVNHTFEAWFNPATLPPSDTDMYTIYSENTVFGGKYVVTIRNFTGTIYAWWWLWDGSGPISIQGTNTPISAGTNYHIVCVKDSVTGYTMYVNNTVQPINSDLGVAIQATNSRDIGSQDFPALTPTRFFDGTIDEVIGYNYTLTGTQIQQHYTYTV